MFTNKKKDLAHLVLTLALVVSIGQCAWAGFDSNLEKLALRTVDGISAYGNDKNDNLYLEDGESYIINANDPEAASIPSTTRLTGNIQITGDAKKISLSLRDADVKQVLRMFADKAKMNIIFHNSVQGVVTLDLKDVSVNTALEFVLDACELTYIRQDNNIIIAAKSAANELSYARQNFTTIPVKYANARSIADFVNNNMFNGKYQGVSAEPVVTVNPSKNELMIFGTEEDEKLVKKLLTKLDVKPMMNVFPVNHVSPKQMAKTICNTILADLSDGSDNSTDISDDEDENDDGVSLGGGTTACTIGENSTNNNSNSSKDGEMENFVANPLTVAFYSGLGTVAVYGGSREQVKMIESFIKLHDKKQPMAYIELSLIQLSEDGSKVFNTEWQLWTPFASFQFGSSGFGTTADHPVFFGGPSAYKSSYNIVNSEGEIERTISKYGNPNSKHSWGPLIMSLNYLLSNGKGRVLASPKIMVTNGKTSTIDLTSDYVKSIQQEYDDNKLTPVARTTYDIGSDQGISVTITPFISPDGYVVMNLNPNYSTLKNPTGDTAEPVTLLSRRNIDLKNVRVKDGETLVLAGMIQENEQQAIVKMPVLGDLPLIGPFFRRTSNISSKEELVILVTPHIVYSKDQIDRLKKANEEEEL